MKMIVLLMLILTGSLAGATDISKCQALLSPKLMTFNKVGPSENRFEMLSTPVTQWQWAVIAESNPSHFSDGAQAITEIFGKGKVPMRPNHPVENVSYNAAEWFVALLNEMSVDGDPRLRELIPDFKRGDRFRLPLLAEWAYVTSGVPVGEEALRRHAWLRANSGRMTHPVGELEPLIIDDQPFYDLIGNVWEWLHDSRANVRFRREKLLVSGNLAEKRGGSFAVSEPGIARSDSKSRVYDTGFRLVRVREDTTP